MKRLLSIAILMLGLPAWAAFDWDPFYEHLTAANGAAFEAWRPFYSTSVNGERWRNDYLWPLYTQKGFKDETYGRVLFFGYSADFSPDTSRHRTWILPFYFQGTSAQGEDYLAVFPLGGNIYEFAGRDRLWFVLFPLFARSSINEVQTTSVLWPIGSKTSGERIERFRIWPLYGSSTLEDEYRKKFVLWPIYTSVKYTNERNPGGGFILMPLYGRVVTENAVNQWFIPPFFRYAHGRGERIVYAPWPFIQWSDGAVDKRYVWPLYGKKEVGPLTRRFWLWPIVWDSKVRYEDHDLYRRNIVPLFYYEAEVVSKPTGRSEAEEVRSRYWKLWPLMSWERNEDASRFRLLDLWPMRNTAGIERNWSPLWTLYQREKSADASNHCLLWGLFRHSKDDAGIEWTLLKGVAGYKKYEDKRSVRLLFMRFGSREGTQ